MTPPCVPSFACDTVTLPGWVFLSWVIITAVLLYAANLKDS